MASRMHLFLILSLSLLLTSVILVMYTQQRVEEFNEHQLAIQKAMVKGAAQDISYRIENQIRHVSLFNDEYRHLISHLALHPHDENTKEIIDIRLRERFPNIISFFITSATGTPVLDDKESMIDDIIKRDISSFSTEVKRLNDSKLARNTIFIHPRAGRHHYVVMASIKGVDSDRNVFFVSFSPEPIQQILKSRGIPGHQLMLTRLHDNTLIEVSSAGTRDMMGREGRLSKQELLTIKASKPIPNTDWVMVDLKDPDYEQTYIRKLWKESGGIILIVAITHLIIFLIFGARNGRYTEMLED